VPEIAVTIVPGIADCSKAGGNWQKTLQKKFPKETSALSLSTPQLSLLRWVLEGLSFNIVKVRRALSAINKNGGKALVELQNFVHAMSLLEIGLDDEAYEAMYQVNGGEDGGKIDFESLSKALAIASARMENKSDVEKILGGVEEGKNWMDTIKSGAAPEWQLKGMPRRGDGDGGSRPAISNPADEDPHEIARRKRIRQRKQRLKEPTENERIAMERVKRYRGSLDGPRGKSSPRIARARLKRAEVRPTARNSTTFQGSLYPPRATDSMDDFARASVAAGVGIGTVNKTLGRAKRIEKQRAKKEKAALG
jgi:hypothetical protein